MFILFYFIDFCVNVFGIVVVVLLSHFDVFVLNVVVHNCSVWDLGSVCFISRGYIK